MTRTARTIVALGVWAGLAGDARAQFSAPQPSSRPVGRVSFFSTFSRTTSTEREAWTEGAFNTSLTLRQRVDEDRPSHYGLDLRQTAFSPGTRPSRTSVYEAYVGTALGDDIVVRGGHMWLDDLGALGSVAGGQVEYRRPRGGVDTGSLRFGAFGGLEPNILDVGYASDVRKFGGYMTFVGPAAQRDTLGYVVVRDAGLTERSVLTTTNYVPVGKQFFVYQAAEVDVSRPAGQAERGLTYMFASARLVPSERLDLQGTYQRGRSIDARGLVEALTSGLPISQQALTGLLYESMGGRATFNAPRSGLGSPTLFGGYFNDRNTEGGPDMHRTVIGGQLIDVAGSRLDISASDSRVGQPTGTYHSRYVSVGSQVTDRVYVTGDYSTSLSVIRFTRISGVTVETRPHTVRWSGTVNANLTRAFGLLVVAERTSDETYRDVRLLSGLTYRIR